LLSLGAVGTRGLVRFNAALLRRRAGVLAVLLRERWGVDGRLADLPDAPLWWINATCIETGKNWRLGKREMGDWQFGRHYEPPLLLAEAVAASAAVPYAIGALRVSLPEQGWYVTDPATGMATKRCEPAARHVHLWDGGAYDNLGLEPLYKPGSADSDEVAQAFRDDVARGSEMMPPGSGASLADDFWHSIAGRSIGGVLRMTGATNAIADPHL
jgi:NTE family protein